MNSPRVTEWPVQKAVSEWSTEHHPPRTLREHLGDQGVETIDEWLVAELEDKHEIDPEAIDHTFPMAISGWTNE